MLNPPSTSKLEAHIKIQYQNQIKQNQRHQEDNLLKKPQESYRAYQWELVDWLEKSLIKISSLGKAGIEIFD